MGLFGMVAKAAGFGKKIVNMDQLQAIVAGAMLVAAADGEIEVAEVKKLEQLLALNDSLSGFSSQEVGRLVNQYGELLMADFYVGRSKLLKEIDDIASSAEKSEEVFLVMLAVAKSDGEIEPAEVRVLKDIALRLRINAAEYGI